MLLKSLELQGYKTFAGRTAFEFAGTITCVVGPNGSGKSNIADAIRWVLGEQSYSLLRGKKTEDMIFSGSELRSRASMASATILFDNSNSWLPIDFSEVAITRRAYRDGSNEYLLNGQRVRLRDISELLGNSGLSERTYTIIGQGLVDAALALRADERRRLFEEAAGIGLYRARREEAQKRLETTRRNLERVEDILAELKPRLRSLERQARRAQEYEQVKADLQLLLREWYGYHWYRAQQELRNARQAAQVQETMLEAVRQEQQDLDGQLAAFRERSQALRAQLGSWHRELSGLHQRREELTRNLAVADERTHSLQTQQQNATSERTRLEQQASAFQERLSESQQQVERFQNELEEARAQVEQVRGSLSNRQAERDQVEHALRDARQQINTAGNQQARLQARQAERQSQIERQQAALQAANQSVGEAQKALREAESRLEQAAEARDSIRTRRQAAEQAVQVHHQQVEAAEVARRQALEQRSGQQAQQARLKAQLEVLDQAEKALAGYASGTRLLLKSAQQGQLKGIQGALAGQLDVPEAYESAIAAALGEYLDAVLLEETHNSDAALELLLNETTRGVLLPLPELAPMAALQPKTIPGLVGLAADLVKAPAHLRPAVDLLLGQTLVVADRKSARQVLAGQPAVARAVTLRGEVFYASGQILAGQGGQASSLSRPRQRREIREQLDQLEKQLAETQQRLTAAETGLHDLRTQEQALEQALEQARRQEKAASEAHDQLVLGRDRARRQVQWQQEQCTGLEQELTTGEQELHQLGQQLQTLEVQLSSTQEAIRRQQAQLHELSLQDFQEQLAHWNTQIAVSERALANARSQQHERQAAFSDAHQTQQQLAGRLAALAQDLQELEKRKLILKNEEVELAAQVDALRTLIDPAESELAEIEGQHDQMQQA
ncbi:MAG: chromosome segregation protein SMC, partial [Anaerolineales bacterium]|nr:chromosome segregation protein SMC [Anaerolineales bacterium]